MLAVQVPTIRQKAGFRRPSVRQQGGVFGKPRPVDAVEDFVREARDFGVAEVLPTREHAAQKQSGVDRGDFGVPHALARFWVSPVVEETPVGGHLPRKKAQQGERSRAGIVKRHPTVLLRDAKRRQSETSSGNAGYSGGIVTAYVGAVPDQAVFGVCLLPKEKEIRFLYFLEKQVVFGRKREGVRGLRLIGRQHRGCAGPKHLPQQLSPGHLSPRLHVLHIMIRPNAASLFDSGPQREDA